MTSIDEQQLRLWPADQETLLPAAATESAYWRGSLASRSRARSEQKALGQFMTPPAIARAMAQRSVSGRDWAGRCIRMLDPAAGSGVLAAALVEATLAMPKRPSGIELVMCELDPGMLPLLELCVAELARLCEAAGVAFDARVLAGDFLLSDLAKSGGSIIDAVIANPPYFKISGTDPRALTFASAVHGQPNIYALFMAACSALVRPGGAYCFITPRSWANGAYFRALRSTLFDRLAVDALHLFDSRQAHFDADAVLQEALIVWASGGAGRQRDVHVTSSAGAGDLAAALPLRCKVEDVIGPAPQRMLCIPRAASAFELKQSALLDGCERRLADLGLRVSTGPVVGFRAAAHLRPRATATTMPMLWMPHVRSGCIEWPRGHRAEHIDANAQSQWMLMRNQPMVLLRRFSPKEDVRRITAAAYLGQLAGAWMGLENHLNVIHAGESNMSAALALGLSGYLNSQPVDDHLRQLLGSTQVNAVELRDLPMPPPAALEMVGREIAGGASAQQSMRHIFPQRFPQRGAKAVVLRA